MMTKTLTCTTCNKEKEAGEFFKDARKVNGYASNCKACAYVATLKSKSKNPEHYRAYMRHYMRRYRKELPTAAPLQ